jgi:anti-sigma-K factor RskA
MHMQVPDDIAEQLRRGATLAVSVEPAGGSPTGLPTGPVIASGALENS